MKQIIENWRHQPGRHCASTALRDVMSFWGLNLSEALCFGLGRGLGAFYLSNPGFSPSKWLMTRGADLEERCFSALDIPFTWRQAADAETAWRETRSALDSGIPALLQTDIYYLDYFKTKTHFNRHAVVLWGYDEESGVGYLTDTEREGLIEVPLASLAAARNSACPPVPVKFDWFPVGRPEPPRDLKRAALAAIRLNAFDLSAVPKGFPLGLNALEALAADLPQWPGAGDWKWSARFAYQAIEKRGTGGSGFRGMYAEFIAETEAMAPEIEGLNLSGLMRDLAGKWTEFALCLKNISEGEEPTGFDSARAIALDLFSMESAYCAKVLNRINI